MQTAMNRSKKGKSSPLVQGQNYVRISLSIPCKLWPFFERQRKKPMHAGNRSSYVRSLIVEQINLEKERAAR